jgi:DNA-binding NarL/FixJ family response regulator
MRSAAVVQDFVGSLAADVAEQIPAALRTEEDQRRYFFAALKHRLDDVSRGRPSAIRALSLCGDGPLDGIEVADTPTPARPDAYAFTATLLAAALPVFTARQVGVVKSYLCDGKKLSDVARTVGITYRTAHKYVARFKAWARENYGKQYEQHQAEGSE